MPKHRTSCILGGVSVFVKLQMCNCCNYFNSVWLIYHSGEGGVFCNITIIRRCVSFRSLIMAFKKTVRSESPATFFFSF